MINDLLISRLTKENLESAYRVFETSIPDAFEKEGLGDLKEDIQREIIHKRHMLESSLDEAGSDVFFLIAKLGESVIGAISFGPCGEDARKCTDNELEGIGELGSLFVLPGHQGKGVGSALIGAMMEQLSGQGIEEFCLDSGYRRAQKRWLRKFGEPCRVVKDYWGPGTEHMVWLCRVKDICL